MKTASFVTLAVAGCCLAPASGFVVPLPATAPRCRGSISSNSRASTGRPQHVLMAVAKAKAATKPKAAAKTKAAAKKTAAKPKSKAKEGQPELTTMAKSEFIAEVAAKAGLTKVQAEAACNAYTETISDAMCTGRKLTVPGFGVWQPKDRAGRQGRNPSSGEAIEIAPSRAPTFSASKTFKDKVKASM